jgi:hypothetical protein
MIRMAPAEKSKMKASLPIAVAALLVALPALAQSPHRARHHAQPFDEGRSAYPPQHACVPLCSMDTSPCDPPHFKAADGRCDYPMIGR